MSVRDRLPQTTSEDVAQSLVSAAFLLGVVSLATAGVGVLSMIYVMWIEVLHTSGAIEQASPAMLRGFRGVVGVFIFAIIGALATWGANGLLSRDYAPATGAGVAAGGYTVVTGIHIFLMGIGVVG